MRQAPDTIVGLASGGQVDSLELDWSALRFQRAAAIWAKLAEDPPPAWVFSLVVPSIAVKKKRRVRDKPPFSAIIGSLWGQHSTDNYN